MAVTEELSPKPPGRVRGRPFEKGRSGNPLGRRVGCRNKTTLAAAALLAGEAATIAAELAAPDLDLIKQGEQGVPDRRERFATGRSGNPAGRPRDWSSTPLSGRSRPAMSSGVCGSSRPITSATRAQRPA
jgi:hypothetical protein